MNVSPAHVEMNAGEGSLACGAIGGTVFEVIEYFRASKRKAMLVRRRDLDFLRFQHRSPHDRRHPDKNWDHEVCFRYGLKRHLDLPTDDLVAALSIIVARDGN